MSALTLTQAGRWLLADDGEACVGFCATYRGGIPMDEAHANARLIATGHDHGATPGPWRVKPDPYGPVYWIVRDARGRVVMQLSGPHAEAVARLAVQRRAMAVERAP